MPTFGGPPQRSQTLRPFKVLESGKLKAVAELFEDRHFDREVIILCVRVRFAPDSPLEEDGFEPSVPLGRKVLERSNISTRRVLLHGGTEGSNPSSSSRESRANRKPSIDGPWPGKRGWGRVTNSRR